jgi:RNA polymerase sigma-70 factor (ECF subfamily)
LIEGQAAATVLYRRYAARLEALARSQLSAQLARQVGPDDIVQSVFATFFHGVSSGEYDVGPGEDAWRLLLVIAMNKVRERVAFHTAAKRDARLTTNVDFLNLGEAIQPAQAGEPSGICRFVVRDCFERLSAPHRQIIELLMEGHEVAEIAARTGRSKRTVERLLKEARDELSFLLEEE